ncbi:MAG TPA: DUF853 family protein [Bacteroidales bacterium]|nr:DUF853 family protein [Bacteroidales bacterium]
MSTSLTERFSADIRAGYVFKGEALLLGTAMLDHKALAAHPVSIPLRTLNRHGLIAGATGTGKTKTLQVIAEGLSDHGIPVLMMDVKGDLSGLAAPGSPHPKIEERHQMIGTPWDGKSYPVELLSISNEPGARMRATVSEFGPVLFSKILELTDLQSGTVAVVFKYCDDNNLPLLDIKDFRKALQYLSAEGKSEIEAEFGRLNSGTVAVILRKLTELESQDAELFFGERSFEVEDLLRQDSKGRGIIHILRLTDIQSRPKLFSTFMLCLLAEVYERFPEEGDQDKPKLILFIDEAHLIFKEASKALIDQIETIIKLIRSKGVGILFCTQSPVDIPNAVLGQLGLKVQHALRAFTAKDRKAIKLVAENYPITDYYTVDQLITSLGTGEAFVTGLNEKGIPTPLVHTLLRAPQSRMDILSEDEIDNLLRQAALIRKYNQEIDRESAYEILGDKLKRLQQEQEESKVPEKASPARTTSRKAPPSGVEKISKNPLVQIVMRELTRGILGVLGVKTTRRR